MKNKAGTRYHNWKKQEKKLIEKLDDPKRVVEYITPSGYNKTGRIWTF